MRSWVANQPSCIPTITIHDPESTFTEVPIFDVNVGDQLSVGRSNRLLVEFVCLELSEMDLILGN